MYGCNMQNTWHWYEYKIPTAVEMRLFLFGIGLQSLFIAGAYPSL